MGRWAGGEGLGGESGEKERDIISLTILILVPLGLFLSFIPCIICVFSEIVREDEKMKQDTGHLPTAVARSRLTSGEGGRERAVGSELERPLLSPPGGRSPPGSRTPRGAGSPRGGRAPARSLRESRRQEAEAGD